MSYFCCKRLLQMTAANDLFLLQMTAANGFAANGLFLLQMVAENGFAANDRNLGGPQKRGCCK